MINKYLFYIVLCIACILSKGCYSDTVDSLSTFHFQVPIFVTAEYTDKFVPDTTFTFTNLNKYEEYQKNLDKIDIAEIMQFNYWIDSLLMDDNKPFNPDSDEVEFESISFYLQFAKFKPGYSDPYDQDSSHFMPDPDSKKHLLGKFEKVNINKYYRNPHNILEVPKSVGMVISEAVRKRPHFYITTEYSKVKDQTDSVKFFPYIRSRYDVIIRFEAGLN